MKSKLLSALLLPAMLMAPMAKASSIAPDAQPISYESLDEKTKQSIEGKMQPGGCLFILQWYVCW